MSNNAIYNQGDAVTKQKKSNSDVTPFQCENKYIWLCLMSNDYDVTK